MKQRTRKKPTTPLLVQRIGIALVLALTLTVFRDSLRVSSGTITRNAIEVLSITGGVLTIAPGGDGHSVMEIGNNGNEIISTGDIYLRPNGGQPGTRFVGNVDGTSNLLLTGKMDVAGTITLGNGDARTTWPYPDHWMTVQNEQDKTTLTPNEQNIGLTIDRQQVNDTGVAGLSLYSADRDFQALLVDNSNPARYAADFNGSNVTILGDLDVTKLYLCGSTAEACHTTPALYKLAWTKDNMYSGGGVDADTLDGVDTYFVGNCDGGVCLCTTMPYGTSRCTVLTALP